MGVDEVVAFHDFLIGLHSHGVDGADPVEPFAAMLNFFLKFGSVQLRKSLFGRLPEHLVEIGLKLNPKALADAIHGEFDFVELFAQIECELIGLFALVQNLPGLLFHVIYRAP